MAAAVLEKVSNLGFLGSLGDAAGSVKDTVSDKITGFAKEQSESVIATTKNLTNMFNKRKYGRLHEQLVERVVKTGITASALTNAPEVIEQHEARYADALGEGNQALADEIKVEIDALNQLHALMAEGEGTSLMEQVLDREAMDSNDARKTILFMETIANHAQTISESQTGLRDDIGLSLGDILNEQIKAISDTRISGDFRFQLAEALNEQIEGIQLFRDGSGAQILRETLESIQNDSLDDDESTNKIIKALEFMSDKVDNASAIHSLSDTLMKGEQTSEAMQADLRKMVGLMANLDGFSEEQTKLAEATNNFITTESSESKEQLDTILHEISDRTVQSETLQNITELNRNFSESVTNEEEMREALEFNNLKEEFGENSELVSTAGAAVTDILTNVALGIGTAIAAKIFSKEDGEPLTLTETLLGALGGLGATIGGWKLGKWGVPKLLNKITGKTPATTPGVDDKGRTERDRRRSRSTPKVRGGGRIGKIMRAWDAMSGARKALTVGAGATTVAGLGAGTAMAFSGDEEPETIEGQLHQIQSHTDMSPEDEGMSLTDAAVLGTAATGAGYFGYKALRDRSTAGSKITGKTPATTPGVDDKGQTERDRRRSRSTPTRDAKGRFMKAEPVSEKAKGFGAKSGLKAAGRGLGIAGTVASTAMDIYDYSQAEDDATRKQIIGSIAGTVIGGALGSFLGPLGTMGGAMLGSYAGDKFANLFIDEEDYLPDDIMKPSEMLRTDLGSVGMLGQVTDNPILTGGAMLWNKMFGEGSEPSYITDYRSSVLNNTEETKSSYIDDYKSSVLSNTGEVMEPLVSSHEIADSGIHTTMMEIEAMKEARSERMRDERRANAPNRGRVPKIVQTSGQKVSPIPTQQVDDFGIALANAMLFS